MHRSNPHSPTPSRKRTARVLGGALAVVALVSLAACGNDDDSAATTTTEATTTTTAAGPSEAEIVRFREDIQQELATVGCYKGNVDGILGPESDAAVLAFQEAAGLKADGQLGPQTEAALRRDAQEKKVVCAATTSTTKAPASTTTASPNGAPCTATALLKGMPAEGEKITKFVCADGWAAGSLDNGSRFILEAQNGQWYAPSQDPCDSASAGLPPVILEDGCQS
jgi:hypothetical protein